MVGRRVPVEKVQVLRGFLAAGLNPARAAREAGVSLAFAYQADREMSGGPGRLAAKRAAAAARDADRAERAAAGRRAAAARERAVLDCLRAGMNPSRAARAAGVSPAYSYRLHRKIGGVHRPPEVTYSPRYLDREERYEIARLRESGLSMRQVAARLGRSPSTISRELGRNADPRAGGYQPERAEQLAWQRQRRPKQSKLGASPALRAAVQGMLDRRYSPEQASGRLKAMHPGDPAMRASHETIYQSLYVYPRGGLKRELQAALRSGRATRRRRGGRESRGKIIGTVPAPKDTVSIAVDQPHQLLYALQRNGVVDEIGLTNGSIQSTFTVDDPGESIAVSPDGSRLYVLKGTSSVSNIAVIDAATGGTLRVLPAPSHCVQLQVSPTGQRLYEVVGSPAYGNIQVFGF